MNKILQKQKRKEEMANQNVTEVVGVSCGGGNTVVKSLPVMGSMMRMHWSAPGKSQNQRHGKYVIKCRIRDNRMSAAVRIYLAYDNCEMW